MVLGKVKKNIWATEKIDGLDGYRFVLVSPINKNYEETDEIIVAVDKLGAGNENLVLLVQGDAAFKFFKEKIPVDAMVIALIDQK